MYFQLAFNSIVSGLLLAVVAAGFNLIFQTTKVFHLAHAIFFAVGAYVFIGLKNYFDHQGILYVLLSAGASIILVAFLAVMIEGLVYQPLHRRKASSAVALISSLAVYIFFSNLLVLLFSNDNKFVALDLEPLRLLADLIVVPAQILQCVVCTVILSGLYLFSRSRLFLRIRAVISHDTVATVMGVNSKKIRVVAMIVGSQLAAIGGILKYYDSGINPSSGMPVTLSAAAAVIIGGNGSFKGTILASLLIALLQTLTEWFLSSQWKEGITFFVLILVVMLKTEGIISYKMRLEEK